MIRKDFKEPEVLEQVLEQGFFSCCVCNGKVLIGRYSRDELIEGVILQCSEERCATLYSIKNGRVEWYGEPDPVRWQAAPYSY